MTGHGSFRLLAHQIRHEHLPLVHRFPLRLVHRLGHFVDRITLFMALVALVALAALAALAQSPPIQVGQHQVAQLIDLVFEDHLLALARRR